jgi:hypothetical protein
MPSRITRAPAARRPVAGGRRQGRARGDLRSGARRRRDGGHIVASRACRRDADGRSRRAPRAGTAPACPTSMRQAACWRQITTSAAVARVRTRRGRGLGASAGCQRQADAVALEDKRPSGRRAGGCRQAVHEPLSALAQAQMVRPVLPGEMLRAAYLVKQNAVERFSAVVRQLQIAHPSWPITWLMIERR